MRTAKQPSPTYQVAQLIINFVIPIVILSRYSSDAQLGPTKAMLLALAFPVAFELFSIYKKRKISMLSVVAIGGIALTGAISLLGLSENWLAARRSIPYFAGAIAILVSLAIHRPLIDWLLKTIIDMETVQTGLRRSGKEMEFAQLLRSTSYILVMVFITIGCISLLSTKLVITGETNTALFNSEYARLRVLSIFFITLPLMAGFMGAILYLLLRLEKLTGLPLETLVKKKS